MPWRMQRGAPLQGAARTAALRTLLASDAPRARFLVEFARASGGDADATSPARERELAELYARLAGLRLRHEQLVEGVSPRPDQELKLQQVDFAMEATRKRLDALEGELAPRADAALAGATDLPRLESWLRTLAPERRIVEYFFGESTSAAWVLSRDAVHVIRLPARGTFEPDIERLHASLARAPVNADDQRWRRLATQLENILVRPLAAQLARADVVVVPHRALANVPFEVLLAAAPRDAVPTSVSYSASTAAAMFMAQRPRVARSGTPRLAIFAAPDFSRSDARTRGVSADASGGSANAIVDLVPLPGTAREADRIASLAPRGSAVVYSGARANRDALFDPQLIHFRMLHFATHALPDDLDPPLSALALSAADARGAPADPLVRMYELRRAHLDADLVVLSACESAEGALGDHEGFAGITHTFIAAGARQVVASQWRVPDAATAALMTEMYRAMFAGGLDPQHALRAAQQKIAAEPRWRHPYFWSSFVVIGNH